MKKAAACLAVLLALNLTFGQVYADGEQNATEVLIIQPTARPTTMNLTTVAPTTIKPTTKPVKPAGVNLPECPSSCECLNAKITCKDNNKWKALPPLTKFLNVTEVTIYNTTLEQLDFNNLPSEIERLELPSNNISKINNSRISLNKLRIINLSGNQLKNLNNALALPGVKFPVIEELSLSFNPFKEIPSSDIFNNFKNLRTLKIDHTKLKTLNENAFQNLGDLVALDMSHTRLTHLIGLRQFASNPNLVRLDLTNNSLIEVPSALRSTSNIENLILDFNLMTSLRRSDFINQTSLITLYVRNCPNLTKIDELAFSDMPKLDSIYLNNNPKLSSISRDAFKSDIVRDIFSLDLSGNNFTSLFDPAEFQSIRVIQGLSLGNNPWNCNCDLEWFKKYDFRTQVHCKSPELYKDMEVGYYLNTVDCEQERSSYHKIILSAFLLFLLGLTIAVFVQKSEFCRRLLWKDQYGTIYYTKASFQPEAV